MNYCFHLLMMPRLGPIMSASMVASDLERFWKISTSLLLPSLIFTVEQLPQEHIEKLTIVTAAVDRIKVFVQLPLIKCTTSDCGPWPPMLEGVRWR